MVTGFRATLNGVDQTGVPMSASLSTKVTFTTEVFDTTGNYDATNSKWIPSAGLVNLQLHLAVQGAFIPDSRVFARLTKNSVVFAQGSWTISAETLVAVGVSVVDFANGSDVYEAAILVNGLSTGTATVLGSPNGSFFSGVTA